jgi:serine protease Do
MIYEPEFLNQNKTKEPSKSFAGLFISVIILSLLFGSIGGLLGFVFLSKSQVFEKYIPKQYIGNLNQKINLTEESAIIEVVKKSGPAVVSIVVSKDISKIPSFGIDPFGDDDFFPPYFSFPNQPKSTKPNIQQVGAGSGFLVSGDGLILTNKHVVSDENASYKVITADKKKYEAKVLARDPRNDLAIIKIEIKDAKFLELADVKNLQIGQKVVAIGYSLGQYQNTVTSGIVSGIGRSITASGGSDGQEQLEGVIQTDAAINPGNSGGPLLDLAGQVVGINTAVDRQGQLVGFAIPSSDAQKALDAYRKNGRITRPFIGVRYIMLSKEVAEKEKLPREYGALILRGQQMTDFAVAPGSPADKAGLVENDIILEVDGTKLEEGKTLAGAIRDKQVGDIVGLKVYHKGEEKEVWVTLVEGK